MTDLLPAFTLEDAREAGLRKDEVYAQLKQGEIERVGRGVYVRHDLSDAIPCGSDIALPHGDHPARPVHSLTLALRPADPSAGV